MARAAHAFAMVNPNVTAEVVECQEFPEMAQAFQVSGVPKTVINDSSEFVGAVPDEIFINAILQTIGKEEIDWAAEEEKQDDADKPTSLI
ncbi:MAG: thioredoxin family protein [Chloroflexi bacterium]|nr:thioredoxin family protein [Chloroflexota bacterium]MDA1174122.1 thioredoxin family protein [Chloroflexota bacterium]